MKFSQDLGIAYSNWYEVIPKHSLQVGSTKLSCRYRSTETFRTDIVPDEVCALLTYLSDSFTST